MRKKARFEVKLNNDTTWSNHRNYDQAVKMALSAKLKGHCYVIDNLDNTIMFRT